MFTIPVLDVKANPLDGLLAVIGYRLSMLTKSDNDDFKELLKDKAVTIQIGSEADGIARYFVFDNGTFAQQKGRANNPSLMIDFKDSLTGVKLLTGGDVTALMSAVQDKDMIMEGDYKQLMWFNKLAKHIVPEIPEEVKPLLEEVKPLLKKAKPLASKAQEVATQIIDTAKQKLNK